MSNSSPPRVPHQRTTYVPFKEGEIADILDDLPLGHSVSEATRDLYRRLRDAQRNPPQQGPIPDHPENDMVYAPIQPVRPQPEKDPRAGLGVSTCDTLGKHGLGVVCNIFVASDGATAVRWLDGPPQGQPRWEFYDHPGTAPFEQLTKYDGDITIMWTDTQNDRPHGDNG